MASLRLDSLVARYLCGDSRVAGAPCKGFNAQPLVELSLGWTAAIMFSYSMYVDLRYRHAWVRTSDGGIFCPIRGVH